MTKQVLCKFPVVCGVRSHVVGSDAERQCGTPSGSVQVPAGAVQQAVGQLARPTRLPDSFHGTLPVENQWRRTSWRGRSLAGAGFYREDLTGADFRGADLTGAVFQSARLVKTRFEAADLTGTDFRDANVKGANFKGCVGDQDWEDLVARGRIR